MFGRVGGKVAAAASAAAAHGAKLAADAASSAARSATDAASAALEKRAAAKREAAALEAAVKVPEFRQALTALHVANVDAFLGGDEQELYPRPGAAEAATGAAATARRLMPLALEAVKTAGYGNVVLAYKVAKGGLAAMLLSPQFRLFAEHVVPMLKHHMHTAGLVCTYHRRGAMESELALRLYYLGCTEAMAKLSRRGEEPPPDARQLDAPDAVLAYLGEWLGPAQWLYAAYDLPPPHDTADWAAWYAARLAKRQGWTTVACVGAAGDTAPCVPTAPEKTPFPAWQLAVKAESLAGGVESRRAVLCIRGSRSENDWRINSQSSPELLEISGAQYRVHGGMLRAARAILEDCGCRAALDRLGSVGIVP